MVVPPIWRAVAAMPQPPANRASARDRGIGDGQFKELGINACGILAQSLIRGGERGSPSIPVRHRVPVWLEGPRSVPAKAESSPQMLPGIRFLLAAILLSVSIVVFGLGAAALLRAAHEDFASNPSWRVTPETRFAQQSETPTTLALLRVETPAPAATSSDAPASAAPEAGAAPTPATPPGEQMAAVSPAPEPERTVAPSTAPATPSTEAIKTEASPPLPAPSNEPAPAAVASEAPPPVNQPSRPDATIQDTKVAASDASDTPPRKTDAAPTPPDSVKPEVASSETPRQEPAGSRRGTA